MGDVKYNPKDYSVIGCYAPSLELEGETHEFVQNWTARGKDPARCSCCHRKKGVLCIVGLGGDGESSKSGIDVICTSCAIDMALNLDEMTTEILKQKIAVNRKKYKALEKYQDYIKKYPEVAGCVMEIDNPLHARNEFAHNVVDSLMLRGTLTEAQRLALSRSLKRDCQKATALPPDGHELVQGVITKVKAWREGAWGITVTLWNTATVWFAVKTEWVNLFNVGDEVMMNGEWQKKDVAFSIGKSSSLSIKRKVDGEYVNILELNNGN